MITQRRRLVIYGALLSIWVVLIAWQVAEHLRVRESARKELIDRAKTISNTAGLIMRSQRFFGRISKERLESALNELVEVGSLASIEMLNNMDEVIASAGPPIDVGRKDLQTSG